MNRKLLTISLVLPASLVFAACARDAAVDDPSNDPDPGSVAVVQAEGNGVHTNAVTEAPQGFDNLTNGFLPQSSTDPTVETFDSDKANFDTVEDIGDGLGPVYNTQSCRECHQNPVSGAGSQVSELRAGNTANGVFTDQPGGSLVNDRAIDPNFQERVQAGQNTRTFRITISTMGDGFVECIDSNQLAAIAAAQPAGQKGTFIQVPVGEANGAVRGGRFGHKNQNSSLLSFAADAYLNEEGITSPLQPTENTSVGRSVAAIDTVADPEDSPDATHPFGKDVAAFTGLMRALKAPSTDAALGATASAQRGSTLFTQIGCAVCHLRTITTVPAGTVVNNGAFTCPTALGDKNIHPFGDYLLHDIGTGDGIVQNGGQGTANMIRTAPLWGLRARDRLMHDGATVSRTDAINRHAGQATAMRNNFNALSATSQNDLINFLNSL